MAEFLGMLGQVLRSVVGEPRGLRRTRARYDTNTGTDDRTHQHWSEHPLVFIFCDFAVIIADFSGVKVQLIPLQLCLANDFHQCEQTDEGNGKVKTQIQTGNTKCKAVIAGHGVCAHTGNKQTKAGGDDALDKALTRNACNNRHAEQADHKVLRRAELCRNFCDLRAEEEQHQRREDTAKGRCIKCNFQRRLSAAHFGQRIAVQHSSRRVGRTRRVDKDSRYRSTIATCAVNAQQEHHAGNRTHGISDRQE